MTPQDKIVHAQVKHYQKETPGGTVHFLTMIETESGEGLNNGEVVRLFQQDRITGVHVKPQPGTSPTDFHSRDIPGFAKITDIEEDYIVLDGEHRVRKDIFHSLYRLD